MTTMDLQLMVLLAPTLALVVREIIGEIKGGADGDDVRRWGGAAFFKNKNANRKNRPAASHLAQRLMVNAAIGGGMGPSGEPDANRFARAQSFPRAKTFGNRVTNRRDGACR